MQRLTFRSHSVNPNLDLLVPDRLPGHELKDRGLFYTITGRTQEFQDVYNYQSPLGIFRVYLYITGAEKLASGPHSPHGLP